MPLPLILGIGAAVAGIAGVAAGGVGAKKLVGANKEMKEIKQAHEKNLARFEATSKSTTTTMDDLGKLELEICQSFKRFSELFEKVKNKPEFREYQQDGVDIPTYQAEEIKKVSVGAGVLVGGLGGAAAGTAGGFAAAGATTAAVMALGTASTGTAIASLSGVAATNATLAALGGGALAAGGGGMALGSAVLGGATLGVGLLVGGIIFNITGKVMSGKVEEARKQKDKAAQEIVVVCDYLRKLTSLATRYSQALTKVNQVYQNYLNRFAWTVEKDGKTDWAEFSQDEKTITENLVLLVSLLYQMCKVRLVIPAEKEGDLNTLNAKEADQSIGNANALLKSKGWA